MTKKPPRPISGSHPVSRSTEEKSLSWTRIGAIGTLLALPITAVGIMVGGSDSSEDQLPPNSTPSSTIQVRSTAGSGAPSTTSAQSSASSASCKSFAGEDRDCSAPDAGLVVQSDPCNAEQALRSFGVDPAVAQLSVLAQTVGSVCLFSPGPEARAQHFTAYDLSVLDPNSLDPRLRLCQTVVDRGSLVSCASRHLVEFVSPDRAQPGRADPAECSSKVKAYTGRTLEGATEPLVSIQLAYQTSEGTHTRCAVASRVPLWGSVYQVRGAPLTTASPR